MKSFATPQGPRPSKNQNPIQKESRRALANRYSRGAERPSAPRSIRRSARCVCPDDSALCARCHRWHRKELRCESHRTSLTGIDQVNPSLLDSSSEISMYILNSAVENVFPCASVIKDTVPPPSRLSCRRKFNAPRFGSSNLSTSPLTIPLKCSLTRASVTSRTSNG